MTAQRPAAPETEADANGLTEFPPPPGDFTACSHGRPEAVRCSICVGDTSPTEAWRDGWASGQRAILVAARERVRVVEGERDAAERSKAALVAKVKRLQDQIARASMEPGQDRQKAMHAYVARAESAEAAHEAEKAAHQRLRAGVEALEDDLRQRRDRLLEEFEGPRSESRAKAYGVVLRQITALLGGGGAR